MVNHGRLKIIKYLIGGMQKKKNCFTKRFRDVHHRPWLDHFTINIKKTDFSFFHFSTNVPFPSLVNQGLSSAHLFGWCRGCCCQPKSWYTPPALAPCWPLSRPHSRGIPLPSTAMFTPKMFSQSSYLALIGRMTTPPLLSIWERDPMRPVLFYHHFQSLTAWNITAERCYMLWTRSSSIYFEEGALA